MSNSLPTFGIPDPKSNIFRRVIIVGFAWGYRGVSLYRKIKHLTIMRQTTIDRHQKVRDAFNALPKDLPAMRIYVILGEQFGYSDEHIRRILRKKHPPN